jgi:hypothetical protein
MGEYDLMRSLGSLGQAMQMNLELELVVMTQISLRC